MICKRCEQEAGQHILCEACISEIDMKNKEALEQWKVRVSGGKDG